MQTPKSQGPEHEEPTPAPPNLMGRRKFIETGVAAAAATVLGCSNQKSTSPSQTPSPIPPSSSIMGIESRYEPEMDPALHHIVTHAAARHHIPVVTAEQLIQAELQGYERMHVLAQHREAKVLSRGPNGRKVLLPCEFVAQANGREAAENARTEGPQVLTCSDERIRVSAEMIRRFFAKKGLPIPKNIQFAKKAGFPGLGVLLRGKDQPEHRFRNFSANVAQLQPCLRLPHFPCGACKGDTILAWNTANSLPNTSPVEMSDYTPGNPLAMSGDSHMHHGAGFEISGQKSFSSEPLGWGYNMHVLAPLADVGMSEKEHDEVLNEQVQSLMGILVVHGWGEEFFAEHPLPFAIPGNPDDERFTAAALIERLQPSWKFFETKFPKARYEVFGFDVRSKPAA